MKTLSVRFVSNTFGELRYDDVVKIEIGPCGADGCNKQEIVIKTKSSNGILSAYHLDDMSDFESNIVDK